MQELNSDIQSDMKIDVRITWLDIFVALFGWVGEVITMPLRSGKNQQATQHVTGLSISSQ